MERRDLKQVGKRDRLLNLKEKNDVREPESARKERGKRRGKRREIEGTGGKLLAGKWCFRLFVALER